MTYSKTLLQPAAIDTSQCVVVAGGGFEDHDQRDARWQHKQALSMRRAKSHSPLRRSPKLRHTNGRLDEDPSFSQARGDKQQLLARLQPTLVVPKQREKDRAESMIPRRAGIRRSITCATHGQTQLECCPPSATTASTSPTRLKIWYRNEALRARSAENTRRMIVNARLTESATATDGVREISSNQQKLALKALKYRNLLAQTNEIDDDRLKDPTFDVLECLGVKWCKM